MTDTLISRLPAVRGRYSENTSLAAITWFRVGGAAEVIFKPASVRDLSLFLKARSHTPSRHRGGVQPPRERWGRQRRCLTAWKRFHQHNGGRNPHRSGSRHA
jgi:hypothetical protein